MAQTPRHYRNALTRVLRATGLLHVPEAALLVATLKDLAEQLDDGAGQRVMSLWISAQKDLQRFLNGHAVRSMKPTPAATKTPAEESEPAPKPKSNDLAEFKKKHGIAS